MEPTARPPRPPLRDRVPAVVRATLAWAAAVASPFILFVTVADGAHSGRHGGLLGLPARYLLPALALALPAGLLRRRPLVALALMLAGAAGVGVTIHSSDAGYLIDIRYLLLIAADLAVCVIAATRSRRVSIGAAIAALAVQIVVEFAGPIRDDHVSRPEIAALAMATAWMIGNSVSARRRYAEALRAQAATQAVTAERLRIARELHDMVAHSIGVIAIQAGMGSRVMDTQPAEARDALRAIEATSRETLAGLRRVVGGLRRPDPARSPDSPLDPAPGLADLDRLAATTMGAGVRVDLRWLGERWPLPPDIDLSAFRIIQEAVTNVVRHAGTAQCRVTVEYRRGELSVEVVDDGRGCAVAGGGYGIAGIRERVALLHGEFTAEPGADGGFRVAARLPVPVGVR
jgi:signal transduction histidine kinase